MWVVYVEPAELSDPNHCASKKLGSEGYERGDKNTSGYFTVCPLRVFAVPAGFSLSDTAQGGGVLPSINTNLESYDV